MEPLDLVENHLVYPNGIVTSVTRRGDWAAAADGSVFFPADPRPEDVSIANIVFALPRICRFGGSIRPEWGADIYSVAQHSLYVYREARRRGLSRPMCRRALVHDAHESYVQDIIRPAKPTLPGYEELEARWEDAVLTRLGLPNVTLYPEVKEIDTRILLDEKRQVCSKDSPRWGVEDHFEPLGVLIIPMTRVMVTRLFIYALAEEDFLEGHDVINLLKTLDGVSDHIDSATAMWSFFNSGSVSYVG